MVFRSSISSDSAAATNPPQVTAIARVDQQLAMYFHIKSGHQNMDYVCKTIKLGKMKGLPAHIPDLKYNCSLCKISAASKLVRGKLTDLSELCKGDRIYAD